MPRPMYRTRSWKRIIRRIPSGEPVIHYEKPERTSKAKCAICGAELNGVPALKPSLLAKLAKTEKRPERPYGGLICPKCLARGLREAIRTSITH